MLKELLKMSKSAKHSGLFLSGVAFGTLGLKMLSSKEAKATYAKALAKSFKLKDSVDASLSTVKQHADDVISDAKSMYQAEKEAEVEAFVEGE